MINQSLYVYGDKASLPVISTNHCPSPINESASTQSLKESLPNQYKHPKEIILESVMSKPAQYFLVSIHTLTSEYLKYISTTEYTVCPILKSAIALKEEEIFWSLHTPLRIEIKHTKENEEDIIHKTYV